MKKEHDYKPWAAYRTKEDFVRDEDGNIVRDQKGKPLRQTVSDYGRKVCYYDGYQTKTIVEPTFMENLHYFFSYQLNYMYWRYFLWNFVGRQDDIQPEGVTMTHGNWLSGIDFIDELYLGPQSNLPAEMENNRARNTYFFLPFILGLVGLVYQLNRDKRGFTIVMWLFIMMGVALVVYFNSSPGEVRERDYVYAGSFYAFSMWIGLGVLALYELLLLALKDKQRVAAVAAIAVAAVVPGILCAENWDDHDRSGRTWARDTGHNYLNSVVEIEGVSPIIVNYGDNDTFPIWFAQEVDGVRTDVRVMNSSYLDGEWYVDEMKCKANDAEGIPFSLPRAKYTFNNDWIPIFEEQDVMEGKALMEFIRRNDKASKTDIGMGEPVDYIPTRRIALPVDKDAAIASGIVKESDRDLIVDTVYINLKKNSLSRSELMLLDLFVSFDWKRPIYFTQAYMLNAFSLVDYLQFDGYAYRLVPILTPFEDSWEIGRIDAEYAYDVLMNKTSYGGLNNPDVYVDSFMHHNIMVARTREAFARVAKQFVLAGQRDKAEQLLDRGLEVLPPLQLRFTMENTYPFLEGYYSIGADDKGDKLLMAYADTIISYVEYYLQFEGFYGDLVTDIIDEKLGDLSELYYLAGAAGRKDVVRSFNDYYKDAFGLTDEELMNPDIE